MRLRLSETAPRAVDLVSRLAASLLAVAVVLVAVSLASCGKSDEAVKADAVALTHGGQPNRGQVLARRYGCGTCHMIPGVEGASGTVGPPLAGIAGRMFIAGVLTNDPEHMQRWLLDPPSVDSNTAMPNVGLNERDARDIAAYLYTLK